jgi:hypothetical protein
MFLEISSFFISKKKKETSKVKTEAAYKKE